MTKNKNTIEMTGKLFTEPSFEEIEESGVLEDKFFNSISTYQMMSHPTKEEIEITEKVLKYASQCEYINFTKEDAKKVFSVSTNILKWNFGYLNDKL